MLDAPYRPYSWRLMHGTRLRGPDILAGRARHRRNLSFHFLGVRGNGNRGPGQSNPLLLLLPLLLPLDPGLERSKK